MRKNSQKRLTIVLGIRPDVIRASIILDILRSEKDLQLYFIWSGQHYSENLKDVFFRDLRVRSPDIELGAVGDTDSELVSSIISKLFTVLKELQPMAAIFLGDTNTVMGCIAAAQLDIPIVHIEGCMRSYDWRMPEEKYRTVIDHLSDVIYAYLDEYKRQGVAEGLNPQNIVVTQNPIVDVLKKYYFDRREYYDRMADENFFASRKIARGEYYLMTCHRRENLEDLASLQNILNLTRDAGRKVFFCASYRTQRVIRDNSFRLPDNVTLSDPVGYNEFLSLMTNSRGVLSDSGTVTEEACILQVPSVQLRKSTERPQVYDVGACVKFDPTCPKKYPHEVIFRKLEHLRVKTWSNPFGDGKASQRIAFDILRRVRDEDFGHHKSSNYGFDTKHPFAEDGLGV